MISVPFPVFNGLDGAPLEFGYVYIGLQNQNPEVAPIAIYWDSEKTIPAAQPLRTVGGYLYRNGSPGALWVNEEAYSMTVRDKNRVMVFTEPSILSPTVTDYGTY